MYPENPDKMKSIFILLLFAFTCVNLCGQQFSCGFDEARQNLFITDPSYRQQEKNADELLYRQAMHPLSRERNARSVSYIPVVVHVVHQNGPENLADSTIIAGIAQLNLCFQNAPPYYDPSGTDAGIQFCLASVDPYGNPTTGITRSVSPLTDLSLPGSDDLLMKNLARWEPQLYLNIWVIRNTGSPAVGGYATYPASAGNGYDGIVVQYNVFTPYTLSHEAGHYLGLHHTFRGGCSNTNCLLDGDMVCDTPPDATSNQVCPNNSCSTEMNDTSGFNPFTGDVADSPNYMDYTNCPLLFTPGQSNRMNAALNGIRTALLQSNGCGSNPGGPVPVASFTVSSGCNGAVLTNTSVNSVGAQWDYNGDGLIDNAGNTVVYNAPATGYYTVTLYASGLGGIDTLTQTIFAQHYPYQNYPLVNAYSGLSISASGQVTACEGSAITFQGAPGMAHYYWSNGDTTQNTTFIADSTAFSISLTAVDSAGLVWSNCYPVSAIPVPAAVPPVISFAPGDTVFCIGQPLEFFITYSPIWYSGSLYTSQGTINGFNSSTYTTTVNLFNNFQVNQTDTNGCSASSNFINITGQYSPYPAAIAQNGNSLSYSPGMFFQWYLNNVPIPNANSATYVAQQPGCYKVFSWWNFAEACGTFSLDSVCILTTEMPEDPAVAGDMVLSPNPFSSQFTLSFPAEQKNCTVKILDAAGREIWATSFTGKTLTIDRGEMSNGIYFIQLMNDDGITSRKIILQ